MFNSDLPKPETVFPFTRSEVAEARKRVIFRRALRRAAFRLELLSMGTEELKYLYFFLLKDYSVQKNVEPRAGFNKWTWDMYYPFLEIETIRRAFKRG